MILNQYCCTSLLNGLLPVKLQAFNGNFTFFWCLDHVLDEIGYCHGFSGLQVQCQILDGRFGGRCGYGNSDLTIDTV